MNLRRARPDEAGVVADVWLRSRHASAPAIPPPVHTDDEIRVYFAQVVVPNRELWVAEEQHGAIVGLCALDNDSIDQLYVDPGATNRGIGSRLLALAKSLRPGGLTLWTFQSNEGARRFYERHGFVAVEFTDGDNEEGEPDVRYRWTG